LVGIDRDAGAGLGQRQGAGQSDGAGADDGDVARAIRQGQRGGALGGAPGQGPPSAAVAVIVHDPFVAVLFGLDARAGGAKRSQTDRNPHQAFSG
jgi:hypothetical protein